MWCDGAMVSTEELAGYAIELAAGAAALVRDAVAGGTGPGDAALEIGTKSTGTDLVTRVDRASEQWLVARITAERPRDAVLGEEGGARPGMSEVRWLLDPIDGTVNFVLGLPAYAVSVAAEVSGTVVAGAVCNPVTGELFHARRGGGAWLSDAGAGPGRRGAGRRLHGPRPVELARAVVGTGFGYDAELRRRQAHVAAQLLPRIADIRRIGSAALDLCAVACGRLDAYYEVGLNPWDWGAGALVAAEAGCVVSGLRGASPSGRMTAVAAPGLAESFFPLLEELDADRVR